MDLRSPLLSVGETASYLRRSRSWVYQELKRYCPHVKIGGALMYRREDLDRFINARVCLPVAVVGRNPRRRPLKEILHSK